MITDWVNTISPCPMMRRQKTLVFSSMLLLVLVCFPTLSQAAGMRAKVVQIYSGNTFRTSDGNTIRVVYVDADRSVRDIVCDEPCSTIFANNNVLNQQVVYAKHGVDYSGTILAAMRINGVPYENILCAACDCASSEPFISAETATLNIAEGHANETPEIFAGDCDQPEAFWQHAFNEVYAKGATEVVVKAGRADIVNKEYAICHNSMKMSCS